MIRVTDQTRKAVIVGIALIFVGGSFAAFAAGANSSSSNRASHQLAPSHGLFHGTTTATSTNWAGYAIKTTSGAVSDVKGSWNVPQIAVACPSSARYSSFWVGIDGDGSNTVEQTGTETDCSGGSASYYAWYEFYPAGTVVLGMTISPADHMHGEVKYSTATKKFTITLKDLSTGKSFTVSKTASAAKRASAEWVAEAPYNGGILPLTNFGWVVFSNASATISGHTHSISGFNNIAITMWNLAGTKVKANPLALNSTGTKFRVNWKSTGP